jgi:hypothetical protein
MCPLRVMVSGLHIGLTHAPETQAPSLAHFVLQAPQLLASLCVSIQPLPQSS